MHQSGGGATRLRAILCYPFVVNSVLLMIAALLVVAGVLVVFFGIRNAPDGFEDEDGFHVVAEKAAAPCTVRLAAPVRPREPRTTNRPRGSAPARLPGDVDISNPTIRLT